MMHTERLNVYNVHNSYKGIKRCLEDGFGEIKVDSETVVQILLNKLQNGHIIIVTIVEDEVVATATGILEKKLIHAGDINYTTAGASKILRVEDVATREDKRGNGYGAAAVQELEKYAKEQGCYKIILDCSEDNYKKFYSRLGYKKSELCLRKNL